MKRIIIAAAFVAFALAPLSSSYAQSEHGGGANTGLPGGHPHSDMNKPGNGDHGNNGSNGGG
jgi:hypothetical protein